MKFILWSERSVLPGMSGTPYERDTLEKAVARLGPNSTCMGLVRFFAEERG
ncbi:hypothetical protein [Deinococcus hopiensis]|uniref:hypothetical protein n=1 Tax=Deinococcus hopiensis TaxID=309885 RepID=UPI0014822C44|nr:hypothetical protein [Deinococcus hopiensis]